MTLYDKSFEVCTIELVTVELNMHSAMSGVF